MKQLEERLRKRQDKGRFWWELRSYDYYAVFNSPKVFWPDIAKLPRVSLGDPVACAGNTAYLMPFLSDYLLALLASRPLWFTLTQLGLSFGERAGSQRYRLFAQSMARLPIPESSDEDRNVIGKLAIKITEEARARYALHTRAQRRILSDLGTSDKKINQKLTAWCNLDFPGFRAEVK